MLSNVFSISQHKPSVWYSIFLTYQNIRHTVIYYLRKVQ